MKNAMRVAAIMQLPVTYVLTHDSIGVGEDGPTHQPVEQLAGLRAIPGLVVFRPCDSHEVAAGWYAALTQKRPVALILSRQDCQLNEKSGKDALKGAYVVSPSEKETPDAILIASGSEVSLAIDAQALLKADGVDARVVSMPCMELFEAQDTAYREKILPKKVRARVAVEALSSFGWERYVGLDGKTVAMESFGASAPGSTLFKNFGFTKERVAQTVKEVLQNLS